MIPQDDADAGAAAAADDEAALPGRLRTQSGPRTVAPMWARPLLTEGEWSIYTALWSFGTWNGSDAWPKHQTLADRACSERGTVINAIAKFVKLGLITRTPRTRADKSQKSNEYVLVEVCPDALVGRLVELAEIRMRGQAEKKAKRDADKRKYRKPRAASPAETTPGEGDTKAAEDVGSLHSDPTNDGLPDWAHDKGGSSRDVPVTYPVVDLSPMDQSPSTAVPTHAADAPASEDAGPPAELGAAAAAPSPAPAVGGRFSPEDQTQLTVAVDDAVAVRKTRTGWARPAVVEAVMAALDAGHPVALVVAELGTLARDVDGTDYPGRLPGWIDTRVRRGEVKAPAAPRKPAAPCAAGCRCWKHTAPAGPRPAISPARAAAVAAARAGLPPGKPLSRYATRQAPKTPGDAGTALSGDVGAESDPETAAA